MPTRRGWGMVAGSVAVIVLGRILGLADLYVVGVAGVLLVAVGIAWVRLTQVELAATRRLRPTRVPIGASVRVEVALRNTSGRRSPVLKAHDAFDAGRLGADWLVAPLGGGESGQTSYTLATERRGVFGVGPLDVELRDPFGLVLLRVRVLGSTTLTVLPLVESIAPPPRGRGGGAQAGAERPSFRGQSGDDFYALRPYSAGDDLRRVHWPSTARRGEIMIRQDDHPWQDRTTVALDTRAATPAALEAAVSAAASLLSAAGGQLIRLVEPSGGGASAGGASAGADSGYGIGSPHLSALLDRLAAVRCAHEPAGQVEFGRALRQLRDAPGGGTLVVVASSAISRAELDCIAALSPRFSPVLVVLVQAQPGAGISGPGRGVRLVRLSVGQPFARAWGDALGKPQPSREALPRGTAIPRPVP